MVSEFVFFSTSIESIAQFCVSNEVNIVIPISDIQFWKNRKTLEGLSVRSVFFNVFQSLIVLLYVLDNETNFVIRVSVFIGLGIELWKIHKVVDVKVGSARYCANSG
jgi:hypothetical protein